MRQNKRNITFLKAIAPDGNAPFRLDSLKFAAMFTNWTHSLLKQTYNALTSLLMMLDDWVFARRWIPRNSFKDVSYLVFAVLYIFLTLKDMHVNFSIRDL